MNFLDINLDLLSAIITDTQKESILSAVESPDVLSAIDNDRCFKIELNTIIKSNILIGRVDQKTLTTIDESSISYLASNILDKHDLNFFVNLPLRSSTKSDDVFDKLTIETRDLLFFGGSTFLSSCIDSQSLLLKPTLIEENLSSVCICFDDYHDLSSFLCVISLPNLISQFKDLGIGIQLIIGDDQSILQSQIVEYLVNILPTSIYGLKLFLPPSASSSFLKIYSYLTDSLYFGRDIVGEYGTSSDELNQLLHSISNSLSQNVRYISGITNSPDIVNLDENVIIVGGGPSLDNNLDFLKRQSDDNVSIIAAGSSIGTLLKHDINVTAVVLLERGSSVFNAIKKLNDEGYSTSDIILISSITVDPRLSSLFKETFFYHRPVSTTAFFFGGESDKSSLLISGPEAVNAAVEVALKLGFNDVVMMGCDFSSPSRQTYRSKDAIGSSPRDLVLPAKSNAASTIYTDETLTATYRSLETALSVQKNVKITRIGLGVKIEHTFYDSPDIPSYPLSFCTASQFVDRLKTCSYDSLVSGAEVLERINLLISSLEQLPSRFDESLMYSPWSIKHHRFMSEILDVSRYDICRETFLPDFVAIELLRNLIFNLFMYMYDSASCNTEDRSDIFDRIQFSLSKAVEFSIICLKISINRFENKLSWDPVLFSEEVSQYQQLQ